MQPKGTDASWAVRAPASSASTLPTSITDSQIATVKLGSLLGQLHKVQPLSSAALATSTSGMTTVRIAEHQSDAASGPSFRLIPQAGLRVIPLQGSQIPPQNVSVISTNSNLLDMSGLNASHVPLTANESPQVTLVLQRGGKEHKQQQNHNLSSATAVERLSNWCTPTEAALVQQHRLPQTFILRDAAVRQSLQSSRIVEEAHQTIHSQQADIRSLQQFLAAAEHDARVSQHKHTRPVVLMLRPDDHEVRQGAPRHILDLNSGSASDRDVHIASSYAANEQGPVTMVQLQLAQPQPQQWQRIQRLGNASDLVQPGIQAHEPPSLVLRPVKLAALEEGYVHVESANQGAAGGTAAAHGNNRKRVRDDAACLDVESLKRLAYGHSQAATAALQQQRSRERDEVAVEDDEATVDEGTTPGSDGEDHQTVEAPDGRHMGSSTDLLHVMCNGLHAKFSLATLTVMCRGGPNCRQGHDKPMECCLSDFAQHHAGPNPGWRRRVVVIEHGQNIGFLSDWMDQRGIKLVKGRKKGLSPYSRKRLDNTTTSTHAPLPATVNSGSQDAPANSGPDEQQHPAASGSPTHGGPHIAASLNHQSFRYTTDQHLAETARRHVAAPSARQEDVAVSRKIHEGEQGAGGPQMQNRTERHLNVIKAERQARSHNSASSDYELDATSLPAYQGHSVRTVIHRPPRPAEYTAPAAKPSVIYLRHPTVGTRSSDANTTDGGQKHSATLLQLQRKDLEAVLHLQQEAAYADLRHQAAHLQQRLDANTLQLKREAERSDLDVLQKLRSSRQLEIKAEPSLQSEPTLRDGILRSSAPAEQVHNVQGRALDQERNYAGIKARSSSAHQDDLPTAFSLNNSFRAQLAQDRALAPAPSREAVQLPLLLGRHHKPPTVADSHKQLEQRTASPSEAQAGAQLQHHVQPNPPLGGHQLVLIRAGQPAPRLPATPSDLLLNEPGHAIPALPSENPATPAVSPTASTQLASASTGLEGVQNTTASIAQRAGTSVGLEALQSTSAGRTQAASATIRLQDGLPGTSAAPITLPLAGQWTPELIQAADEGRLPQVRLVGGKLVLVSKPQQQTAAAANRQHAAQLQDAAEAQRRAELQCAAELQRTVDLAHVAEPAERRQQQAGLLAKLTRSAQPASEHQQPDRLAAQPKIQAQRDPVFSQHHNTSAPKLQPTLPRSAELQQVSEVRLQAQATEPRVTAYPRHKAHLLNQHRLASLASGAQQNVEAPHAVQLHNAPNLGQQRDNQVTGALGQTSSLHDTQAQASHPTAAVSAYPKVVSKPPVPRSHTPPHLHYVQPPIASSNADAQPVKIPAVQIAEVPDLPSSSHATKLPNAAVHPAQPAKDAFAQRVASCLPTTNTTSIDQAQPSKPTEHTTSTQHVLPDKPLQLQTSSSAAASMSDTGSDSEHAGSEQLTTSAGPLTERPQQLQHAVPQPKDVRTTHGTDTMDTLQPQQGAPAIAGQQAQGNAVALNAGGNQAGNLDSGDADQSPSLCPAIVVQAQAMRPTEAQHAPVAPAAAVVQGHTDMDVDQDVPNVAQQAVVTKRSRAPSDASMDEHADQGHGDSKRARTHAIGESIPHHQSSQPASALLAVNMAVDGSARSGLPSITSSPLDNIKQRLSQGLLSWAALSGTQLSSNMEAPNNLQQRRSDQAIVSLPPFHLQFAKGFLQLNALALSSVGMHSKAAGVMAAVNAATGAKSIIGAESATGTESVGRHAASQLPDASITTSQGKYSEQQLASLPEGSLSLSVLEAICTLQEAACQPDVLSAMPPAATTVLSKFLSAVSATLPTGASPCMHKSEPGCGLPATDKHAAMMAMSSCDTVALLLHPNTQHLMQLLTAACQQVLTDTKSAAHAAQVPAASKPAAAHACASDCCAPVTTAASIATAAADQCAAGPVAVPTSAVVTGLGSAVPAAASIPTASGQHCVPGQVAVAELQMVTLSSEHSVSSKRVCQAGSMCSWDPRSDRVLQLLVQIHDSFQMLQPDAAVSGMLHHLLQLVPSGAARYVQQLGMSTLPEDATTEVRQVPCMGVDGLQAQLPAASAAQTPVAPGAVQVPAVAAAPTALQDMSANNTAANLQDHNAGMSSDTHSQPQQPGTLELHGGAAVAAKNAAQVREQSPSVSADSNHQLPGVGPTGKEAAVASVETGVDMAAVEPTARIDASTAAAAEDVTATAAASCQPGMQQLPAATMAATGCAAAVTAAATGSREQYGMVLQLLKWTLVCLHATHCVHTAADLASQLPGGTAGLTRDTGDVMSADGTGKLPDSKNSGLDTKGLSDHAPGSRATYAASVWGTMSTHMTADEPDGRSVVSPDCAESKDNGLTLMAPALPLQPLYHHSRLFSADKTTLSSDQKQMLHHLMELSHQFVHQWCKELDSMEGFRDADDISRWLPVGAVELFVQSIDAALEGVAAGTGSEGVLRLAKCGLKEALTLL